MNTPNKEVRYLNTTIEIRSNEEQQESRHIEGYAVVFESESLDMGFTEVIRRGAITEELIKQSDVCALWNHNPNWLLGRSVNGEGTLQLSIDDHGLRFALDLPHTTTGDDVLELIRRGDVTGCSFAFSVSPEDGAEEWVEVNGHYTRYINKISGLYDVSPVVTPAYQATEVSARALDNLEGLKKEVEKRQQEEAEAAEKARVDALNENYDNMLSEVDNL